MSLPTPHTLLTKEAYEDALNRACKEANWPHCVSGGDVVRHQQTYRGYVYYFKYNRQKILMWQVAKADGPTNNKVIAYDPREVDIEPLGEIMTDELISNGDLSKDSGWTDVGSWATTGGNVIGHSPNVSPHGEHMKEENIRPYYGTYTPSYILKGPKLLLT